MAEAALALIDALDEPQRAAAVWAFDDERERTSWFYTPTDHGGLVLQAMEPRQQQLVFRLLEASLSEAGYNSVCAIIGLENILDRVELWDRDWGWERGRDPQRYFTRIFGNPGGDEPWGWRFGGHHVSVNHVIVGGELAASTPMFLGADPADSPLLGGHLHRPLAAVEDLGRELVRSLSEEQRAQALLSPIAPVDLASGNLSTYADGDGDLPPPLADVWRVPFDGRLGELVDSLQEAMEAKVGTTSETAEAVRLTHTPRGLSASELTDEQQAIMRGLLDTYVRRIPDSVADLEAAKYADDQIGDLSFAWAGGIEKREPHYYRIQGPRLLAEYDNTQRDVNHIHSVWRDPVNDFGRDPLRAHYAQSHS